METRQSLRHICANGGGEKIERSMQETVGGWRKRAQHSQERGTYTLTGTGQQVETDLGLQQRKIKEEGLVESRGQNMRHSVERRV